MPSLRARWTAVCLAVLTSLLLPTLMFAQGTSGRILGRVSDPTGAVIVNVKVTLVNEATNVSRDARTSASGDYDFVEVPVGTYRLEFDLTGFKKNIRRAVTLDLNQVITLNMTLQLGESREIVDVTSEAPLVETSSTQLGTVVNDRAIVQLPLNERDTYQFLSLQPGVQSQVGADLYFGGGSTGSVSVNGGRGRANNFSVNGGDANDLFANLPTVQPSPDSVEEFRILTNGFDAEYGRNSGSVVNLVTKSGTNAIHGDLYEFHRNRPLNAKGYLDPTKEAFILNQFGATIGGPIKKDRTFFFGSYDGRRRIRGVSSGLVSVPSMAETGGVFSGAFGGNLTNPFVGAVLQGRPGCSQAIATNGGSIPDPTNAALYPTPWTTLFPQDTNGNTTIPVACQDPVAADLMNQYVTPYVPQAVNGQLVTLGSERDRQDQGTIRFDHRINDKQNFSAYYYLTDETDFNPFNTFQAAGANLPGFGDTIKQRFQQYNLSHTWTISNSLVNEARFTYMREAQGTFGHSQHTDLVKNSCKSAAAIPVCFTGVSDSSAVNNLALPRLGITPGLGPQREGVPDIAISGGFTIGNNFEGEIPQVGNSFQWTDSITKVHGNHTFKFGADVRRMRFDQHLYFEVSGYYNYFGTGVNTTGFSDLYPDYLLGLPDQYQQGAAQVENVRATALYTFAQDSWKIRPNLTLNYGLRWELNTPLTDIGHHVQTFRPGQNTTTYPCQLSQYSITYFQNLSPPVPNPTCDNTGVFPTGLVVPGDKGVPAGLTQTYYNAFAPRIGIAWSPGKSGKTSIRAGWGMFYNPIEQLVLEQFSAEPPFGGSTLIFGTLFNTPFYAQSNFQYPNAFNPQGGEFTGIQNPKPNQPVDWSIFRPNLLFGEFQPHMRTQYSDQYNFTIQHELARNLVLQVGFVGSQGHRLLATTDLNRSTPATCLDTIALSHHNANNVTSFGSQFNCGPFLEDSFYTITLDPTVASDPTNPISTFHLPNGTTHALDGSTINFVGLRPYSSPSCQLNGTGCPPDGIPVFSNIFAQDTIANSSYNSFQADLEKRFSNGLQMQAAYTFSKSMDQASSFEDLLNPFNPRASRSLSLFDARQRLVISYVYQLPVPKYSGVKGQVLDGWEVSGITQFQSGFPVHIQDGNDSELTSSIDFSAAGTPDLIAPFQKSDPRKLVPCFQSTTGQLCRYAFAPSSFANPALGNFGTARRTICCGPGLNNSDFSIQKEFPLSETKHFEFRWDIFNIFNHTHFFNIDGNITDGSNFGTARKVADPRLMQVALKFYF
ncbi:MAG TPA: carboxypeptidase regulatory-like domain-containing protein [Candidatus Dormibacteraeota bacterium]|nr:carboxypeptidase regulatory-like domain-containing protein [Candidatus Dormibacteraeota bacterium]